MIKVLTRSGNLANLLKTTTPACGSNILPAAPAVPDEPPFVYSPPRVTATAYTSACALPARRMLVVSGPAVKFSVRYGHTDMKVPDFSSYRKNSTKDPNKSSREALDAERFYKNLYIGIGGAAAIYAAKVTVHMFVASMAPAANVLALAKIEVNKSDVPEGKNVTFKWRGKPLFIRHRTDEEINTEAAVDISTLRHPEHDRDRVKDPKWLVVIGVCTHLGCVPVANAGDWGGYYCPCHGSHYDASGRIRKGPAPLNLEIPPYQFVDDTIVVG